MLLRLSLLVVLPGQPAELGLDRVLGLGVQHPAVLPAAVNARVAQSPGQKAEQAFAGVSRPFGRAELDADPNDPGLLIEKRVSAIASERGISKAKAYDEFLRTEEGQRLYDAYLRSKSAPVRGQY